MICKTEYWLRKSHIDRSKYCSRKCAGLGTLKKIRTKDTLIEKLIEKELNILNIRFQKQFLIKNITIADFYIPEQKIVIYCDGDYWHSLPENFKRDIRNNKLLTELGFNVIRLKEKNIKKNPRECLLNSIQGIK